MKSIGLIKTSLKENERRVPIHPEFLHRFSERLRARMIFEKGFGRDYGLGDGYFMDQGCGLAERAEVFARCEVLVLPKSTPEDLGKMKEHQVLFGWAHCVQRREITQAAIDRRLTVIAWESMHHWSQNGEKQMHVFQKNNEIAGYAAVLHCLQLLGIDGHYGPRKRVVVLSYGAVSRGAIYALQGRGFNNIRVFTQRPPHFVADQNPDVYYGQYMPQPDGSVMAVRDDGVKCPLIDVLADADIICNGVLQDVNRPIMFVHEDETDRLKSGSLIIDISCDAGMGFWFARPTSFAKPIIAMDDRVIYYSVDHTPSHLWNAASREISKALLPFLEVVAAGDHAWEANPTIRKAIEIRDGVIKNQDILLYQGRRPEYPHVCE